MSSTPGPGRGTLLVLVAVFLVGAVAGGFAQSAPAPVNGTIVSISGNTLRLALADNTRKDIALDAKTLVLERDVAMVSDLQSGQAMGVAARRDGTNLIATSINIFSKEMWEFVRKGQWLMDSGETMTNAMVTDSVQGMSGHTITMKYNDVMATITVPDGIPIHRLVTVKRSALVTGLSVSVRGMAGADGTLKAAAISFDGPART